MNRRSASHGQRGAEQGRDVRGMFMTDGPVLVVGGTGSLGSQVVDALLARGKQVHALVRPTSDAG
ncbi:NmrA family NAD(P)-binding protein, partial [Streptomyces mirabilis]|uniref:NmrA family NAD(P)-binding protein n=1 Tax=Streptomyces mirabilis TaxID=68239 RepID=UPI0036B02DA3